MKKAVNISVAVLLVISIVCFTGACSVGSKGEIKSLISDFQTACNELDFEGVLNCINPKVSDKINLALDVVGMLTDTDTEEMFENLSDALSGGSDIEGTDFFSSMKIEVNDIAIEDESATVNTIITYDIAGEEKVTEATFSCIYYAEKWYISSFSFD